MKKILFLITLLLITVIPMYASEVKGVLFQNTKEFLVGTNITTPEKLGKAKCVQVFGIVAVGDCSVTKAMTYADIQTLSHADRHIINVLGIKVVKIYAYGK